MKIDPITIQMFCLAVEKWFFKISFRLPKCGYEISINFDIFYSLIKHIITKLAYLDL